MLESMKRNKVYVIIGSILVVFFYSNCMSCRLQGFSQAAV